MLKALIAEDELMIEDVLECALVEAAALFELHKPDLASLHVRRANGGRGSDILRRIVERDKAGMLTAADGEGVIVKPDESANVVRALKVAGEIVTEATISAPFRLALGGSMFNVASDAVDRS